MAHDPDLKVSQAGCDGTAQNFRPIHVSTNMQSINSINLHIQEILRYRLIKTLTQKVFNINSVTLTSGGSRWYSITLNNNI